MTCACKKYWIVLANRLKDYELRVMNQVDGLVSISPEDERNYAALDLKRPIITVPFGIDMREYVPSRTSSKKYDLFHLGAMDWLPNTEGVSWFLNNVWEGILRDYPDTTLHLAGKASSTFELPEGCRSVQSDGRVPDSKDYMRENGVMIVPLLSGGGIRIKILEGMALGKVIISTTIGAEGIGVTHDENILIANSPEEFKHCLKRLREENDLADRISHAAEGFIKENYDYGILAERLVQFYNSLKKPKRTGAKAKVIKD